MQSQLETAYILHVQQGESIETVARVLNVQKATVHKWARLGKWREMRSINNLTPARLVADCYKQCSDIMQAAKAEGRVVSDSEAMRINRLINTANKTDYDLSPNTHMNVLEAFNSYLVRIKPELTKEIIEHELKYVRRMVDDTKRLKVSVRA